jgi:putative transposase
VGSCASSASGWAPRRSGRCCDDTAWARRRDAVDRPGRSSSKPRPRGSWPATCFTVETIRLHTLYVLVFIQLSTRRVIAAGVTAHPDTAWVTQQARNAAMDLDDRGVSFEVFGSEGGQVLRTPIRAPKANAYAERWVQTVRAECLDWTLVLGRRHLVRLLRAYVRHYNQQRPHRGLALAVPEPEARERGSPQVNPRQVRRRDVLGGLIHEYHQVAA